MKVLFSGFEPFGNNEVNPSSLLMQSLERGEISIPKEMHVDQIILPVTFQDSYKNLKTRIDAFNPDVVICFGLAENREQMEFENLAVNIINAKIPDNNGEQPEHERINRIGADSYLSTLPIAGFSEALNTISIESGTSQNAGEYVCNYLFYKLMESNQESERLCGFIHIPPLSELSLEDLKKAVEVMLNYLKYE